MVKIVSDSFETLGGGAKAVAGQVKQVVKGIGDDATESVGLKPAPSGTGEQGSQQQQQKQDDQIKKMDAKSKSLARKRYQEIRDDINKFQVQRQQEVAKYHQPGFTDEEKQKNQVYQLEEKKPPFEKASAGGKELPELPKKRAQTKTERLRGVSG